MELKHTPAPWLISDSGNEIIDSEQFIFADIRRHAILYKWYEKGFDHWSNRGASKDIGIITAKANASLIAAAPELLEALIELTESAKEAIDGLGDLSDAIDTAKAAISKALGQQ